MVVTKVSYTSTRDVYIYDRVVYNISKLQFHVRFHKPASKVDLENLVNQGSAAAQRFD